MEKLHYNGDLTFAVRCNTPYYECKTFRDKVLLKEQEYDGLIFFGHNKGMQKSIVGTFMGVKMA